MSVLQAIAVFLCGFLSLRLCRAQLAFPGNCPDVSAMTDFDPSRYTGKWYEAEKYFFLFEFGGKCVTADYETKDDGTLAVVNKQLSSFTGIQSEIDGEATQISRSDEGKLSVRFPSLPVNVAAPYWVVDTDYDNYAIIWSCNDFGLFHTRNSWIMTRDRNPQLFVMEKVYKSLDKNNINRAYFLRTDQSNCSDDNDS
ncbi:apolipoprotein D [Aphomia sociella]